MFLAALIRPACKNINSVSALYGLKLLRSVAAAAIFSLWPSTMLSKFLLKKRSNSYEKSPFFANNWLDEALSLLIVEDEEDLRSALERKFKKMGFNVFTAEGGHEGLTLCVSKQVDVVLTDIRMAKGTGLDLIDGIRNACLERSPVIICMSAFSDLTLEGAYAKGVDAFFPKPIESSALVAAIQHFSRQRAQRLNARNNSRLKSAS